MGPKGIKPEDQIRKISKIEANKVCIDCPEKMPAYVNLTHRTFVCTKCSGHHRNLQFKIKGISMTQFTDDDVKLMESGGNGPHNALYMARYVPGKDMPIPNGNDPNRMKEFIKLKYDKKWYSADGVSNNGANDFSSNNVNVNNGGRMTVALPSNQNQARKSIGGGGGGGGNIDLLDMMDAPAPSVFSPSNQHGSSFNAFSGSSSGAASQGFDAFGSAPAAGGNQGGFGSFGAPEAAASNNSFDAFGTQSQPTQSFDNFGQQMNFQQQQQQQPMGFGQQGYMNQGQNFGQAAAPMVFIKTAPPAPAPTPEPVSIAPPPKPVIPGFSAFDDLVIAAPTSAPVSVQNSANPFDMVNAGGPPQHNPFGGAPGYPPQQQQQQYGMPGVPQQQQQYGMPGYPQHQQQQQQQQTPYGMPPQQAQYGMPPNQFGYNPQYGMPPGAPQQMYGMPPGAQFQNPGMYPPNMAAVPPVQQPPVAPVPAPVAAPDPFSSMTGLAFETVGKAAPPRSSITPTAMLNVAPAAVPTPIPAPVASANPFDMF